MLTKIQKWGNSQGLRFPKAVLEDAQIKVGDEVSVSVRDGKIIVETPEDYRAKETDWGSPVGKEEW